MQHIIETVSNQRNNNPSLNNIDVFQQLAADQGDDDSNNEFGDLFASLSDQTAAAMKSLGIDLNEDDL